MQIKGMRDLEKALGKIQKQAQDISGDVPFSELFTASFMSRYTSVTSFEEFLELGGYGNTAEEFKAIPDDEFDTHVAKHTPFGNWRAMQEKAGAEYVKRKLGL